MTTMRNPGMALLALLPALLLTNPRPALAADPPLHVDPTVKECSVRFAPELTQADFARFAREFGSVSAFKLTSAPVPLGRGHVEVGLQGLAFTIEQHANAWNDTFVHPDADHELGANKNFPMVRARVGVAKDVDLGAFFTRNFEANYGWLGVDATWIPLRQGGRWPLSFAARAAYTRTLFVDDMDMHTFTSDFVFGRTIAKVLTPYVSFGSDVVIAVETSKAVSLKTEVQDVAHAVAGLEYRGRHVAIGIEGSRAALGSFQTHVSALF